MLLRSVVTLGIAAVLATAPAAAQERGTLELGGFGRYTFFDETLGFDDKFGGGGRLGFFIFPRLMVELDASLTSTNEAAFLQRGVSYLPIHAYLTYNQPLAERIGVLLGAGYVHNEFGDEIEGADNGVAGLLGLRIFLAPPIALRIDGTVDYMPSPANLATANWHYGIQAGLSLVLRRGEGRGFEGPRDSDRDGVTDGFDACPSTPSGARVDGRGCPVPEDADGDGVEDSDDACPDTAAGARVDARGCPEPEVAAVPADGDGDGVPDASDACPNTPADTRVDARGCPLPRDSDGDGVMDRDDACPNTPAGQRVDTRGCPVAAAPPPPPADRDGDGVPDASDACPNTPGGRRVDVRGCPIMVEVTEAAPATEGVLEGVNFRPGTAAITPESRAVLDRVAQSLLASPGARFEVAGYTDSSGSPAYNMSLSQARANMVRWYLIDRGVPSAQLTARGYGPENPIASNDTPDGRARNRRVELRRLN